MVPFEAAYESISRIDYLDSSGFLLPVPLPQVSPLQDLQVVRSAPWLMQDESRGKWVIGHCCSYRFNERSEADSGVFS